MKGMIDIHCHILPGVDDGASDMEESLAMLSQAYECGIQTFIATPHYPFGHKKKAEELRGLCRALEEKARQRIAPDITIYPGNEIYYREGVLEKLEEGRVLTLADSPYILTEYSTSISYTELFRVVRQISLKGYFPILAHVERYRCLRERSERLSELTDAGALLQMNYASVSGAWHDSVCRWCRKMLREQRIHLLATDMHDRKNRSPDITRALQWMEKHLDQGYIREICGETQRSILKS